MYPRRTSSGGPLRWIVGLAIIAFAVIIFTVFQNNALVQPLNRPIPTNTRRPNLPTQQTAGAATATPQPITWRIFSAKAQLSAIITEIYFAKDDNWDLTNLRDLAGHLEGTPEMGKGGNYVLAGHVELKDGSPGPFARLSLLAKGDLLTIVNDSPNNPVAIEYAITEVTKTNPQDLNQIRNHGYEELTLVTCDDWDPKTLTYSTRIVIHARPAKQSATEKPGSLPGVN